MLEFCYLLRSSKLVQHADKLVLFLVIDHCGLPHCSTVARSEQEGKGALSSEVAAAAETRRSRARIDNANAKPVVSLRLLELTCECSRMHGQRCWC